MFAGPAARPARPAGRLPCQGHRRDVRDAEDRRRHRCLKDAVENECKSGVKRCRRSRQVVLMFSRAHRQPNAIVPTARDANIASMGPGGACRSAAARSTESRMTCHAPTPLNGRAPRLSPSALALMDASASSRWVDAMPGGMPSNRPWTFEVLASTRTGH